MAYPDLSRQLFCFQNITKCVLLGIDILYVLLFLYQNKNRIDGIVPKECANGLDGTRITNTGSKDTHFRWKIKWRLEPLCALGIMGEMGD